MSVFGGIARTQSKAVSAGAGLANRILNTVDREGPVARVLRSPGVRTARNVGQGVASAAAIVGVGAAIGTYGRPAIAALLGGTVASGLAIGYRARWIEGADESRGPAARVKLPEAYQRTNLMAAEAGEVEIYGRKRDASGSTTFLMPDGSGGWVNSRRQVGGQTISALKSSSVGSDEYYFKGELSNQAAVEIATGQARPHKMPGYLGTVSGTEKLSPIWAGLKRNLMNQSAAGSGKA